jgi:hypothetical protein
MVNLLVQNGRKWVRRWRQPWRKREIVAMAETGRAWQREWRRNGDCNYYRWTGPGERVSDFLCACRGAQKEIEDVG